VSDTDHLCVTSSVGTPYVPTVLPTVGSMDYPISTYSRNLCSLRCVGQGLPCAVIAQLAELWYSPKKHFKSDIEEELAACVCVSKGLQLQAMTDFRSQTAPIPDSEKDVRAVESC